MAFPCIFHIPDCERIYKCLYRDNTQIFHTNRHQCDYEYKHWMHIIVCRLSYTQPSGADKLNTTVTLSTVFNLFASLGVLQDRRHKKKCLTGSAQSKCLRNVKT